MILFYSSDCDSNTAFLEDSEAIHCKQALRKKVGDQIYLTDGLGQCYLGEITSITKKRVEVGQLEPIVLSPEKPYKIHVAIAPTKNISRFEWFLEKATEFGIDEITPLLCARSERKFIKEERLNKILISAMKQSLKSKLPRLNPLMKLTDYLKDKLSGELYIAHLEENPELLINSYASGKDATVLIGPEGDFSPEEIQLALACGFKSASLGDYRLRTETAGIAAVQQIHNVNNFRKV